MALPEYHMQAHNTPLFQVIMHAGDGRYDLTAPYQRDSVWTPTQRRNLIRSLLMGIPVGTLILSDLPYQEGSPFYTRVVDGKQRIEAIHGFVTDQFTVPTHWFDDPTQPPITAAAEVHWSDLPHRAQRRFESQTISVIEVKLDLVTELVPEGTPGARRATGGWYRHTRRSDDEILAAEADLYLLINRGGVPHSEADLDTARAITGEA